MYLCDPAFNGGMRESGKQLPLDAAGSIEKECVARCLGASGCSECQKEGNGHGNKQDTLIRVGEFEERGRWRWRCRRRRHCEAVSVAGCYRIWWANNGLSLDFGGRIQQVQARNC